ncbi:palmitoyl-acyl carrier protein thioesterase, chloroplastic [Helianthus annuus]|nr:palmitoyl-acyl carrier protein thioesterase, chloroplastic [Helianthus annuus]XP_035842463.1 palmitoyl-acyl carrier protein thioesterase, chloroplastic [Helianthus annuus]
MSVAPLDVRNIILDGYGYRQRFNVRSYEAETKNITIQSIFNFLEEASWNYVRLFWVYANESGATRRMIKNDLRWVVSRMELQIDEYPNPGDQVDIDTWVGSSGKNGMRRDWEIKWADTGKVFARATSTWAMVNQKTRRVWKMPDEVRAEISHSFIEKQAIIQDHPKKLCKIDDNARYVISGLQPKRKDMDMNNCVSNKTYVDWMLEAIPDECLNNYQLSKIILEYRSECKNSDVVQSISELGEVGIIENGYQENIHMNVNTQGDELPNVRNNRYTHLLQVKGESKCEEIVRGETTWKKRLV